MVGERTIRERCHGTQFTESLLTCATPGIQEKQDLILPSKNPPLLAETGKYANN